MITVVAIRVIIIIIVIRFKGCLVVLLHYGFPRRPLIRTYSGDIKDALWEIYLPSLPVSSDLRAYFHSALLTRLASAVPLPPAICLSTPSLFL